MDPFKVKSEDSANSATDIATAVAQQQASAQVAAAFAAAAGNAQPGTALNVGASNNDASIEAILSQQMPKHLMDRAATSAQPPSMPPGAAGANQHHPVAGTTLYYCTA